MKKLEKKSGEKSEKKPIQSPWTRGEVARAVSWGFSLTLLQLMCCLLLASLSSGPARAYFRFIQWDSYHYLDIVDRGYHIPLGTITEEDVHSNRANVAYFPAYPIIAKGIHVLGIPTPISLLIIAHFFCLLVWSQFFLLLSFWGIHKKNALRWACALILFPASFFLVMGYSESLFMAALLGLILWMEVWISQTDGNRVNISWAFCALSGFLLTSTRLVGLPLMAYPLIRWSSTRSALLSFMTAAGGLSFFAWSQLKFGQWNLYFKLQQLGWDNHPNYLALFNPSSYIPRFFFEDTVTSVCRGSNAFILCLFCWLAREEWSAQQTGHATSKTQRNKTRARLGLYFTAFSMFFICLSGKANAHMDSMVRYNLPVLMVILLAMTQLGSFNSKIQGKQQPLWILGSLLAAIVQIWMAYLFSKGGWVA